MAYQLNHFILLEMIMNAPILTLYALMLLALTAISSPALAQKKEVSCKLKSEKIIQGREKQCLYVCPDQSLEGRTRKKDSDCPPFIITKLQ